MTLYVFCYDSIQSENEPYVGINDLFFSAISKNDELRDGRI